MRIKSNYYTLKSEHSEKVMIFFVLKLKMQYYENIYDQRMEKKRLEIFFKAREKGWEIKYDQNKKSSFERKVTTWRSPQKNLNDD